jgi:dihydrofolate reductase
MTSLDGYIADQGGNFDWAEPDEEVHAFVNDLERTVGRYLMGRRMYEVWPTGRPHWRSPTSRLSCATSQHSTTLDTVPSARTRIERQFNPEAVRQLRASAEADLTVGGPNLAAHAIKAGLVDHRRPD